MCTYLAMKIGAHFKNVPGDWLSLVMYPDSIHLEFVFMRPFGQLQNGIEITVWQAHLNGLPTIERTTYEDFAW